MSKAQWPELPENLVFDAFDDEDLILDFINALEPVTRRVFLDALDKSAGEDIVIYSRTPVPTIHMVLMKFSHEKDGGLVLLLSRSESHIYSHFERLKEQTPKDAADLDHMLSLIHEQIRMTNEMLKQPKKE